MNMSESDKSLAPALVKAQTGGGAAREEQGQPRLQRVRATPTCRAWWKRCQAQP
jgi:hypothetical protein